MRDPGDYGRAIGLGAAAATGEHYFNRFLDMVDKKAEETVKSTLREMDRERERESHERRNSETIRNCDHGGSNEDCN